MQEQQRQQAQTIVDRVVADLEEEWAAGLLALIAVLQEAEATAPPTQPSKTPTMQDVVGRW